jgi:RNA polymerase sigma-70 factor (ECF subfamily)
MQNESDEGAIEEQIPAVRRYARALVRDDDRADDLVQDCLERAISRFHQFERGTNLRTWLFRILHNRYCDILRQKRRAGPQVPFEDWEYAVRSPANQGDALEVRDLQRALARLSKQHRQVLLLISLEGFSYEEAASVLNIPVGTVRSRLFRAREHLRSIQSEMHSPSTERHWNDRCEPDVLWSTYGRLRA